MVHIVHTEKKERAQNVDAETWRKETAWMA